MGDSLLGLLNQAAVEEHPPPGQGWAMANTLTWVSGTSAWIAQRKKKFSKLTSQKKVKEKPITYVFFTE